MNSAEKQQQTEERLSVLEKALAEQAELIKAQDEVLRNQAQKIDALKKDNEASHAENERLRAENKRLRAENGELKAKLQKLEDQNKRILDSYYLLRKRMFGASRERMPDDTPWLGQEFEIEFGCNTEVPPSEHVKAHDRKKKSEQAEETIPDWLPVEIHEIRDEEAEKAGMTVIGYESTKRLAARSSYYAIEIRRFKYADKAHPEKGVITAPAPANYFNTASSKTKYDVSFVAKVISDKYENAIPLERQSAILAREKIYVNSSTLGYMAEQAAERLQPLYDCMVKLIMDCEVLHVDETHFDLQEKGRKKCRCAWFWCRVTELGPPMIAFHFSKSRSKQVAQETLGPYLGTIIRDSYAGYHDLQCESACCWVHVRRNFFEAFTVGSTKAEEFVKIIDSLFSLERQAKREAEKKGTDTALFSARKRIRRKDSAKIVDMFFEKCRAMADEESPSSKLSKAIHYPLNIESELRKFLLDPKLTMDNNSAERMIRSLTIIRKNSLFTGSEKGGNILAVLYSFAKTCQANEVSFRKWLEDVLVKIGATPESELNTLLPHLWKKQQSDSKSTA